jgi:predicted ATP-grasp superfamily ATP-dependent carboligase
MDKIKQLQVKKLLKELEFVESDYEYKSEAMTLFDAEFMNEVDNFLQERPELKEKFESTINKNLDEAIKKQIDELEKADPESENYEAPDESEETHVTEKSPKVKKLYREIAKITHPDRVKDKELNEFYIKATKCYEGNDLSGLYFICNELEIEYELDEYDDQFIAEKIEKLKSKIQFMESTFTWMWHVAESPQKKEMLVMNYIQTQLMSI